MATTNDTFGRMVRGAINAIADFEGKNALVIQEELGDRIGMAHTAFHRFKQGIIPQRPQIIEILAEAAVQRAYLNRIWLRKFLAAARYYDAATLIDRLYPSEVIEPRPRGPTTNLPAPTYGHFVMRADAYAEVIEGMKYRSAVIAIISIGGMGKTSLAHEVATQCFRYGQVGATQEISSNVPQFDGIVWISDKDQMGSTTLSRVLDTSARTLDYPGLTRLDLVEKQLEIEQLLRRHRVLIVIDNFETIVDQSLLPWLLRLPEPSKALITTREDRREFQRGAWRVELSGMRDAEARQFIALYAKRLKIQHVSSEAVYQQLIVATGGNPKAIELVLGYVKQTGQSFDAAIDSVHMEQGALLTDLFDRSWALLNQDARQTLQALTLFPSSVGRPALAHISGISEPTFTSAVQYLSDLALIDIEQPALVQNDTHRELRLRLHPLTRTFALTQLAKNPVFAQSACERWLQWCVDYAANVGFAIHDLGRLDRLDTEEEILFSALLWAFEQRRYREVIQLAKGMEFFYYVRALWGKKLVLHQLYIDAASALQDVTEEIAALALHIQLLCRQDKRNQAEQYLPHFEHLGHTWELHGQSFFDYHHTIGIYQLANDDPQAAQQVWKYVLEHPEGLNAHMIIGAQHWLGVCLHQQGALQGANALYQQALDGARLNGFDRYVGRNLLQLALIAIDEGHLDGVEQQLAESREKTAASDWEQRARLHWVYGHFHARRGDISAACADFLEAMNLFERMGLMQEFHAARNERDNLTDLELRV